MPLLVSSFPQKRRLPLVGSGSRVTTRECSGVSAKGTSVVLDNSRRRYGNSQSRVKKLDLEVLIYSTLERKDGTFLKVLRKKNTLALNLFLSL